LVNDQWASHLSLPFVCRDRVASDAGTLRRVVGPPVNGAKTVRLDYGERRRPRRSVFMDCVVGIVPLTARPVVSNEYSASAMAPTYNVPYMLRSRPEITAANAAQRP
jgi:hypothetical protein